MRSFINVEASTKVRTIIDRVSRRKAHPEVYLYTAQKFDVEPTGCVVEDSPVGALAASRAGVQAYGLLKATSTNAAFGTVRVE